MSKIDIIYKMEKMVENIVEMKSIINEMYDMEKMVLKLSFETDYNNRTTIRISLKNSIEKTFRNNGLIILYHKHFKVSELKDFNENEIILKFFDIQKDLKEIDLKYEISDKRKENE